MRCDPWEPSVTAPPGGADSHGRMDHPKDKLAFEG
jgi:hypothetical protein